MRPSLTWLILLTSVGCAPVDGVVERIDAPPVQADTDRTLVFEGRLLATALDRIHLWGAPTDEPVLDEDGEPICVHLLLVSPGAGQPDPPVRMEPPWGFQGGWPAPCSFREPYPLSEPLEDLEGRIDVGEDWPPAVDLDLRVTLGGRALVAEQTVQTDW